MAEGKGTHCKIESLLVKSIALNFYMSPVLIIRVKKRERSVGDACYERGSSRIVTNSKMEKYHHRDRKECKNSLGHGDERRKVAEIEHRCIAKLTRILFSSQP